MREEERPAEEPGVRREAPIGSVAGGFYVYRSNRTEKLVDALVEVVARPHDGGNPFTPECIVVQGRGMERWLSMELARRLGVWANPEFPFPRHFIESVLASVPADDKEAAQRFQPEILTWSVAALLAECQERPEFAPIQHYLEGENSLVRRVQLAERIAHTFDQYVVFRPEMVLGWEQGREHHWQAHLWRELVALHGPHHIASRARRFVAAAADGDLHAAGLPARVSLFGLSTLAPLYVELLVLLSARVPLHVFVLSPSPEYWAWVRSRRELLRDPRTAATGDLEKELRELEGNPLLASFGHVGREFQEILEERADYQEPEPELYVDPGNGSMLSRLQADIFALRSRGSEDVSRLEIDASDESIVVHACHGPMREVEVLHDQLRDFFEKDPTLEPQHVIVMSPDIDAYAPYIDAVFGGTTEARERIPYRVADRRIRATEEITDAFLTLLGVLRGRMRAPEVMDLLEREAVRERFGIVAEELDLVRTWIRESGVRWGVDAEHRTEERQPPLPQNTWRFGLDRLLLGYAMPGHGRRLYADVLPYDDVEGTTTELLGRVAEFCDQLFTWRRKLRQARPLGEWSRDLAALLDAMLASSGSNEHQHQRIRETLDVLAGRAHEGRFGEPLGLDLVRSLLEGHVEGDAPGRNFLAGGVTFCALVPMRSIPFRVVCLLGLNDDSFPRVQRPLGFDLIAQKRRSGDRSVRHDDRQLVLEALLAARDRLIVTYVGQSIRDNTEIPPSVVVSELLDVIESSFSLPARPAPARHAAGAHNGGPESGRRHPLRRHPLQPFSPDNFQPGEDVALFSYARHAFAGAQALRGVPAPRPPFLASPLPAEEKALFEVELDDLVRFFGNPVRGFLQRRLALRLGSDSEALEDLQPLQLNGLEEWKIGDELLRQAVQREDFDTALQVLGASGRLPPGTLGKAVYDDLRQQVDRLAEAAAPHLGDASLPPHSFSRQLGTTTIRGTIANAHLEALVQCQFSRLGGPQEIGVWIRHLVLNWLQPEGYPRRSYLVGRPLREGQNPLIVFRPVADAQTHLAGLLRLYQAGQRFPLPLFPRTSRRYAENLRKNNNPVAALAAAREEFERQGFSERHDEYVRQAFGDEDPLDPGFSPPAGDDGAEVLRFAAVAARIFLPMLEHREAA
jgi:exodeoxyribonuclease V gamma subunit